MAEWVQRGAGQQAGKTLALRVLKNGKKAG